MASLELQSTFLNIRGKLNKRERMIFRQKKYRAETGAVLGIGSQESYVIVNPRDYKKNPPQGTELRNIKVLPRQAASLHLSSSPALSWRRSWRL